MLHRLRLQREAPEQEKAVLMDASAFLKMDIAEHRRTKQLRTDGIGLPVPLQRKPHHIPSGIHVQPVISIGLPDRSVREQRAFHAGRQIRTILEKIPHQARDRVLCEDIIAVNEREVRTRHAFQTAVSCR